MIRNSKGYQIELNMEESKTSESLFQ